MFSAQRSSFYQRLSEVRDILSLIHRGESSDITKTPDPTEVISLRGLFYVHMYSVLEHSVQAGISRGAQLISAANIPMNEYSPGLYMVALDPEFDGFTNGSRGKQFDKRYAFLSTQASIDLRAINDNALSSIIQNIDLAVLRSVHNAFCLPNQPVPDPRYGMYINEIKENRNAVAHGRISAFDVGMRWRHDDLKVRFEAIEKTIDHYYDSFHEAIAKRLFVRADCRKKYLPSPSVSPAMP